MINFPHCMRIISIFLGRPCLFTHVPMTEKEEYWSTISMLRYVYRLIIGLPIWYQGFRVVTRAFWSRTLFLWISHPSNLRDPVMLSQYLEKPSNRWGVINIISWVIFAGMATVWKMCLIQPPPGGCTRASDVLTLSWVPMILLMSSKEMLKRISTRGKYQDARRLSLCLRVKGQRTQEWRTIYSKLVKCLGKGSYSWIPYPWPWDFRASWRSSRLVTEKPGICHPFKFIWRWSV